LLLAAFPVLFKALYYHLSSVIASFAQAGRYSEM